MEKGTKRYMLQEGVLFNAYIKNARSIIFTYGRASEHADFFKKASKAVPVDEQQKGNIMLYLIGDTAYVVSDGIIEGNADCSSMFFECKKLECIDFGNFDTSKAKYMYGMFWQCASLQSLDISGFDTGQAVGTYCMFKGCTGLQSLDLSNWNTGKVTDMRSMFAGCTNLKTIRISEHFVTDNVKNSVFMFDGCYSLVGGNGTVFDSTHTYKEYARIDKPGVPGYFTKK